MKKLEESCAGFGQARPAEVLDKVIAVAEVSFAERPTNGSLLWPRAIGGSHVAGHR